jgi:hypothetical protein
MAVAVVELREEGEWERGRGGEGEKFENLQQPDKN